jgi:hypothetical protein
MYDDRTAAKAITNAMRASPDDPAVKLVCEILRQRLGPGLSIAQEQALAKKRADCAERVRRHRKRRKERLNQPGTV